MSLYSNRFARIVWLTHHARSAIEKRGLDEAVVLKLIEAGDVVEKGEGHYWIHGFFPERQDNRICAAVTIGQAVVVKTVMVNWQVKEELP